MTDNPQHRDTAAVYLESAEGLIEELGAYDPDKDIALAQTHALIAIGHALVDLAKNGLDVFTAS